MGRNGEVERYLDEVARKQDWFLDPFTCDLLSVTEHGLKIIVTLETPEEELCALQSRDASEDNLLPVFYAVATSLLPSSFDFRSNRRVLVVGGPACGKSTLLKHMAVLCASRQTRRQTKRAEYVPYVPLVLSVAALSAFARDNEGPASDLLERYYTSKVVRNYPRLSMLLAALRSGRFWLLLDGLDEAVDQESRETVLRFLASLVARLPHARVVMTSRHGVPEESARALMREMGFCTLRMRPLTTPLASGILSARLCGDPQSAYFSDKALPLWLRSELRRPQFRLFRKSPMTLALLASTLEELDRTERAAVACGASSRMRRAELDAEEEQCKKSCQGRDLMPPYSRIELFRLAICKLLRWRPRESENKTTCLSPASNLARRLESATARSAPAFSLPNALGAGQVQVCRNQAPPPVLPAPAPAPRAAKPRLSLDTAECHQPDAEESEVALLQLLQLVAYHTHERNTRELRLRDLLVYVDKCDRPLAAEEAARQLISRINADEAPLFTIEDRNDFLEEETLEQQQHQREAPAPAMSTASAEERRSAGVVMFLHQSLQAHFAAEHIASEILAVCAPEVRFVLGQPQRVARAHRHSCSELPDVVPLAARSRGAARRASMSEVQPPPGPAIDYEDNSLREAIRDKVERLMLGHFEPRHYRIAQGWWQPVILAVFDLLHLHGPPPAAEGGPTLFDVAFGALVEACSRLQQYNNGRAPKCLEALWLAAAVHGNVRVAQGFLKTNGPRTMLQAVNEDWNNALHLAAVNNQPEMIRLLMAVEDVDADYLDRNNRHGWDPSNMAMVFNHTHCFRLLCSTDGDKVAEMDEPLRRPLLVDAAMKGRLSQVRKLLAPEEAGEDGEDSDGETDGADEAGDSDGGDDPTASEADDCGQDRKPPSPLAALRPSSPGASPARRTAHPRRLHSPANRSAKENSAKSGNRGAVSGEQLSQLKPRRRGADPLDRKASFTNAHEACVRRTKGRGGVARPQQRRKCDVNAKGSTGMTAAMWAARNGHAEILRHLIQHGADVKAQATGISTLIFAVESGHVECVKLLLEAGADAMDRTPDDDSSLLCACSFGFDAVAKVLIEAGASALEALVVSCVQGKDQTVRSLVESGLVDVNTVWHDLMVTPLAGACVAGHVSTVKLLLALGANPNISIDVEYGSSPLMLACHMGNLEVVQTMLAAGADVNARTPPSSQCAAANGLNTTAVSIARVNSHVEVERLLRSHGGKEYVPLDLDMFEWLGGHVVWPLRRPDFAERLLAGNELSVLIEDDEFLGRVDLMAWQHLGGRTQGEAAWEPRTSS